MKYNLSKLKKIVCRECECNCAKKVKCNDIEGIEKIFIDLTMKQELSQIQTKRR